MLTISAFGPAKRVASASADSMVTPTWIGLVWPNSRWPRRPQVEVSEGTRMAMGAVSGRSE